MSYGKPLADNKAALLSEHKPSMAPASERVLELSIDNGTVNLSVACKITHNNGDNTRQHCRLVEVPFAGATYKSPQMVAFLGGKLVWGDEVNDALHRGDISHEEVLELWKLLLYKEHRNSPEMKLLRRQLKTMGLNVLQLTTMHLSEVLAYTQASLKQNHPSAFCDDIMAMPVHLYLGVPQMWSPPAVAKVLRAAKEAGFCKVEAVPEPISAAAFQISRFQERLAHECQNGDTISVIDLGGGTGDFLLVRLESSCGDGARVHLSNVGKAMGAECGSKAVKDGFIRSFEQKAIVTYGSMANAAAILERSEADLLKFAGREFTKCMEQFSGPGPGIQHIFLPATGGKAAMWHIAVSGDEMAEFFEPIIEEIERCIDTQNANVLLITGGFGHNKYVRHRLKATYQPKGVKVLDTFTGDDAERPVSMGSLLRYPAIEARSFNTKGSFGIAREEEYSKQRHPDATTKNGKIITNRYDGRRVVHERWYGITAPGNEITPGTTFLQKSWQLHAVTPNQRSISVQIYWTELNLADGAPIRDGATARNPLRSGVECWDRPLELIVRKVGQSLKSRGFRAVRAENGAYVYEVYTKVQIDAVGANVKAKMYLAKANTPPYTADAIKVDEEPELDMEILDELTLGEEEFNPFTRPNQ